MQYSIASTARVFGAFLTVAAFAAALVAGPALRAQAPSRGAAPAGNDACTLLTQQDAAAALGESVTGPRASGSSSSGAAACEYSGSGLHKINLNVMHLAPDMASMYKALCAKKTNIGLAGVGDTACWYNEQHRELQVLKGTTFFSIEISRNGDATVPAATLAKKIYDKLK